MPEARIRGRLAGKTALITGASGGIGRAIAEAFAEQGADLVLHGRSQGAALEAARAACADRGVDVHLATADLGARDFEAEPLLDQVMDDSPELDIVVSVAGAYFDVPVLQMTSRRFDDTWHLNVRAGYLIAIETARRWVTTKTDGRILFVGSINGQLSEPVSTAYDISKAAVHGMVRALCVDLAPLGIRVNGLAPGLIRTPATAWLESSPDRAHWAALHTPNGMIPGPESCGEAAVFLVSDQASHVHGHILNVDGGLQALQFPRPPTSPQRPRELGRPPS